MTDIPPPEGFLSLPMGLGFNDAIAPIYYRPDGRGPGLQLFAWRVLEPHCNPLGICHGGALTTFSDIALCAAVCDLIGKPVGMPTISLAIDFMNASRQGAWLECGITSCELKNNFAFAGGNIVSNGKTIARVSGTFKVPHDRTDILTNK